MRWFVSVMVQRKLTVPQDPGGVGRWLDLEKKNHLIVTGEPIEHICLAVEGEAL